jgi:hypothetical protein
MDWYGRYANRQGWIKTARGIDLPSTFDFSSLVARLDNAFPQDYVLTITMFSQPRFVSYTLQSLPYYDIVASTNDWNEFVQETSELGQPVQTGVGDVEARNGKPIKEAAANCVPNMEQMKQAFLGLEEFMDHLTLMVEIWPNRCEYQVRSGAEHFAGKSLADVVKQAYQKAGRQYSKEEAEA